MLSTLNFSAATRMHRGSAHHRRLTYDDADKDDGRAESLLFSGDPGGFVMHGRSNAAVSADGHAEAVDSHDDLTLDPTQSKASWSDVK